MNAPHVPAQGLHHLRWKGRVTGPHALPDIRAALAAGEISRVHQIEVQGEWRPLEDFLREADSAPPPAKPHGPQRSEEERTRMQRELLAERGRSLALQQQFDLLREEHARAYEKFLAPPERRMSRLAVAAFILSLCNFIPFLNFVTWIPALVLANTALAEMDRNENLDGRGFAQAAVLITSVFLLLAVVLILALAFGWFRW